MNSLRNDCNSPIFFNSLCYDVQWLWCIQQYLGQGVLSTMLISFGYFPIAVSMKEVTLCFFGKKEIDGDSSSQRRIYPPLGTRPLSAATWLVRRLEGANGTKGCVAVASMMPPFLVARIARLAKDVSIHSQPSFGRQHGQIPDQNSLQRMQPIRQDSTADPCTSSLLSRIRWIKLHEIIFEAARLCKRAAFSLLHTLAINQQRWTNTTSLWLRLIQKSLLTWIWCWCAKTCQDIQSISLSRCFQGYAMHGWTQPAPQSIWEELGDVIPSASCVYEKGKFPQTNGRLS